MASPENYQVDLWKKWDSNPKKARFNNQSGAFLSAAQVLEDQCKKASFNENFQLIIVLEIICLAGPLPRSILSSPPFLDFFVNYAD